MKDVYFFTPPKIRTDYWPSGTELIFTTNTWKHRLWRGSWRTFLLSPHPRKAKRNLKAQQHRVGRRQSFKVHVLTLRHILFISCDAASKHIQATSAKIKEYKTTIIWNHTFLITKFTYIKYKLLMIFMRRENTNYIYLICERFICTEKDRTQIIYNLKSILCWGRRRKPTIWWVLKFTIWWEIT